MANYSHSMNAEFVCKPGVTAQQIAEALAPLATYLGWNRDDLLQGYVSGFYSGVEARFDDGDHVKGFTLYTSGEVRYEYIDIVKQAAQNLGDLVEPTLIELKDMDTPELESAIDYIWSGSGEALELARKAHAVERAIVILAEEFTKEEVSLIKTFMADLPACEDQPAIDRPRG